MLNVPTDTRISYNKQFRIFLGSEGVEPVATLCNPMDGVEVEVEDACILDLLAFAAEPRAYSDCVAFLRDAGMHAEEEAQDVLARLLSAGVVASENPHDTVWDHYGWREAAYFHFLARNSAFLEHSSPGSQQDIRTTTIREYERESVPPEFYKHVSGPSHPLVSPAPFPATTLWDVLRARKTTRSYRGTPVAEEVLSSVLWHGSARARAVRNEAMRMHAERPEMLMKSLFTPFEVYVVVHHVSGIEPGVYHYDMDTHALSTIGVGDFQETVVRLIWGQPMARKTAFTLFLSCVFDRYQWRYRYNRAYRNLLISLGEFAQLFILAATALGLGNTLTPALRDSETDQFLQLDSQQEHALYYLGFGL